MPNPGRGSAPAVLPTILWALLLLFCLRVAGQALVVFIGADWLPPIDAWQSGLLSYPWLLLSQAVIILVFGKVCLDVTRGRGFFAWPRPRLGAIFIAFGLVYLVLMMARYGFRMALHPGERWTGGSIPTFFHWVLAGFILVVGRFHWRPSGGPVEAHIDLGARARSRLLLAIIACALLVAALWSGYWMSGLPVPRA